MSTVNLDTSFVTYCFVESKEGKYGISDAAFNIFVGNSFEICPYTVSIDLKIQSRLHL